MPILIAIYRDTALLGGPLLLCADFDRLTEGYRLLGGTVPILTAL